jgi:hypothetical protein
MADDLPSLLGFDANFCSQTPAAAAGHPERADDIVKHMEVCHFASCSLCMLSVCTCRGLQLLLANPSAQTTALLAKAGVDKHHRCE